VKEGRELEPRKHESGLSELELAQNLAPIGAQGRIQSMLRNAQARNSLAQPQLRAAYSSLRLQPRVLRSRSGNGFGEVKIGV
jgi:hypothetical protein